MARSLELNDNESVSFFYLNNSMIWQKNGICELINKLKNSESNIIYFPTESYNPVYHVQPYFVFANLNQDCVKDFSSNFEWIRNFHLKRSLIYFNEYRIARKLLERNWQIRVIAPYKELIELENQSRLTKSEELLDSTYRHYNPTQHMWKSLSKFHINGVKRSLVFKNPLGIKNSPKNVNDAFASMDN
jgi:hypothetical protein